MHFCLGNHGIFYYQFIFFQSTSIDGAAVLFYYFGIISSVPYRFCCKKAQFRGPGGRDDKGKSAFPPTHCAEVGVVGSIPTHGQLAVPWVYLCDLSVL